MFIVLDGVDGSGKKTQTQLLKSKLHDMGKAVDTISYPNYGQRSAIFVEKFLNGEFGRLEDVDPYVASTFYAADRFAQRQVLEKKLAVYDYVISDRYSTSSFIHRGSVFLTQGDENGMRDFFSWLYDFEFQKACLPLPDKIFFLSLSLKSIEANLTKKQEERLVQPSYVQQHHHGLDLAEKDLEHQKYSLLVGKEILPSYFDNYIVIECEDSNGRLLSPQVIHQKILKHVLE